MTSINLGFSEIVLPSVSSETKPPVTPGSPSNQKVDINQTKFKKITRQAKKNKCQARTYTGKQCIRLATDNEILCKCHQRHNPYGKINQPVTGKLISQPQKRGPKFKSKTQEINDRLYLKSQGIMIDGQVYLMELTTQLLLKQESDHLAIVGRRVGDEIHWYD